MRLLPRNFQNWQNYEDFQELQHTIKKFTDLTWWCFFWTSFVPGSWCRGNEDYMYFPYTFTTISIENLFLIRPLHLHTKRDSQCVIELPLLLDDLFPIYEDSGHKLDNQLPKVGPHLLVSVWTSLRCINIQAYGRMLQHLNKLIIIHRLALI